MKILSGTLTYDEFVNLAESVYYDTTNSQQVHAYKNFERGLWYLQSRMGVNSSGILDLDAYSRAMKSYLGLSLCDNNMPPEPWELLGPSGNDQPTKQQMGLITSVYIDPNDINNMLIGSSTSGIWKTTNKGLNWIPVTDNLGFPALGISSFAASPVNPNLILASTGISHAWFNMIGVGLLRSDDGGSTWNPVTGLQGNNGFMNVTKVIFDYQNPSRLYLITNNVVPSHGRLYKSEDNGMNWTEVVTPFPQGAFNDICALENGRLFLSQRDDYNSTYSVHYSDNFGASWSEINIDVTIWNYDFTTMVTTNGWTSLASPPDDSNIPLQGVVPGWSIINVAGENALALEPSAPSTEYHTIKRVFSGAAEALSVNTAASYNINVNAYLPAHCGLDIVAIKQEDLCSTEQVIYHVNPFSTGQFVNMVNSINFDFSAIAAFKIIVTTDSFFSGSDNFWIKNLSISTNEAFVSRFHKNEGNLNSMLLITEASIVRSCFRTTDGGDNFNFRFKIETTGTLTGVTGGNGRMDVVELISNPNTYFSGGVKLYQTIVPGGSINTTLACGSTVCHDDVRGIVQVQNPITGEDVILVGNDGGVSLSEDGGVTWNNVNGDLANSQFFSIDVHEPTGTLIGGVMDNNSMKYQNDVWSFNLHTGDGTPSYIDPSINSVRYIVGDPQKNYFSYSGWSPSIGNLDDLTNKDSYLGMPLESSFASPNLIYYGLGRHGGENPNYTKVVRYDTSTPTVGPTWFVFDPTSYGVGYTDRIRSICISESNPNIIFTSMMASNGFQLWRSDDSGVSYYPLFGSGAIVYPSMTVSSPQTNMNDVLQYRSIRDIAISHSNSDKVWIVIDNTVQSPSDPNIPEHGKWRVLFSNTGGLPDSPGGTPIWYDYSEGLPALPVNTILYVDGFNDLVFVGTDAGVFYRNADMEQWECFNNGFPPCIVTDLEFDYCSKTLYASTFGRSVYQCSIPFYLDGTDENSSVMLIDANTTWNTDMTIRQTVRIQSGVTLTVSSNINFVADKKIIVEPDARLVVNGGVLTNACGSFWGGIEVWGTSSQSQFDSAGVNAQGEVFITNGAIIEHAEVAVRLIKPGDWASTGGFVQAYSSTFRNNRKDIEFGPYSNDYNGNHFANKSRFTNCVFTWDDNFRDDVPLGHVTMYKVDGINFLGCDFADERDVTDPDYIFATQSVGIKSIDSKYKVAGRCLSLGGCSGEIDDPGSGWDPSTFTNLYFGIYASNATSAYTINVDRCIFTDNGYGVELVGVPSPVIVRNKFVFTDDPSHYAVSSAMHGIHAVNSKMLTIEENDFTDYAPPGTHWSFGVVCSDLGAQIDKLYKNTFTDMRYGVYAQGKNRNTIGSTGLYFECNDNTDNKTDHRVVGTLWSGPLNSIYGVKKEAGSVLYPMGIDYSVIPSPSISYPFSSYYNTSSNSIKVWYYPTNPPFTYNVIMASSSQNNSCPTHLSNYTSGVGKLAPSDKSQYESGFISVSNIIAQKEAEYNDNLLDPTETAYILNEIDNLAPNNKQSTRNILNSYSPYLTTAILFEVADNTPSDFNHPWLRDLLLANIEAVTPELIDFLGTKEYPLPTPMRQEVANAIGIIYTSRTLLESEISQLYEERAFYSYWLIVGVQHDSDYVNTDSLRYQIRLQDNALYQQLIIDSYLQDGNFGAAKTETDNYAILALSAPADQRQEMLDFVKLKRWMLLVLQTPGKIAALGSNDLIFLRDMALNAKGTAQYQAQNILCFFYNECDYYLFYPEDGTKSQLNGEIIVEENIEQPQLKIYPNPAANWVMIELSANTYEDLENAQVVITDISGKIIHQTNLTRSTYLWETGIVESGIYLIMIKSDEGLFATEKIIINR